MTTTITFQDSKGTTLDSKIISGFRTLNKSPGLNERIFSFDLLVGRSEVQIIRLEYVIPDENIRKEFAEFMKNNPDKKHVTLRSKWTKEDYITTKKLFDQDVEFVRNLLTQNK